MPAVICTHCGAATQIKPLAKGQSLEKLFCRACESQGTLVDAVFDYDSRAWRARTDADPPDLTEVEIDGRQLLLSEISVVQDTLQRCRRQAGEWLVDREIFDLRSRTGKHSHGILCRLIALRALEMVGLQVVECDARNSLIRYPAKTEDPSPKTSEASS